MGEPIREIAKPPVTCVSKIDRYEIPELTRTVAPTRDYRFYLKSRCPYSVPKCNALKGRRPKKKNE